MSSTKILQKYFQNFYLQLRLPQTAVRTFYSSMCTILNHNYTEHSCRKFEKFVRYILTDDIGKVRRCNNERSIGTSWLLPSVSLCLEITALWHKFIVYNNNLDVAYKPSALCYVSQNTPRARNAYRNLSLITIKKQTNVIKQFKSIRYHWGDLGVDGWIVLGWISRRWDVGMWTGLGWPRIETGGGCLWVR